MNSSWAHHARRSRREPNDGKRCFFPFSVFWIYVTPSPPLSPRRLFLAVVLGAYTILFLNRSRARPNFISRFRSFLFKTFYRNKHESRSLCDSNRFSRRRYRKMLWIEKKKSVENYRAAPIPEDTVAYSWGDLEDRSPFGLIFAVQLHITSAGTCVPVQFRSKQCLKIFVITQNPDNIYYIIIIHDNIYYNF